LLYGLRIVDRGHFVKDAFGKRDRYDSVGVDVDFDRHKRVGLVQMRVSVVDKIVNTRDVVRGDVVTVLG